MVKIYGIKNCDTVKKALKWLEREGVDFIYHDFRKDGLTNEMVQGFVETLGYEKLVNTRGTTWRKLPEEDRAGLSEDKAIDLMTANDALIKRPVWEFKDGDMLLAFGKKEQTVIADKLGVTSL